jgi:hypothetical protein
MSSDFELFEEILLAMRKAGASKQAQGLGNNIPGLRFCQRCVAWQRNESRQAEASGTTMKG